MLQALQSTQRVGPAQLDNSLKNYLQQIHLQESFDNAFQPT